MYFHAIKGDKNRALEFLQKAIDMGLKNKHHDIKNDKDLPEDFRNDPRFIELTKNME